MKKPKSRKRLYTVLGLLALLYTVVGSFFYFTSTVDYFGPPSEYHYSITNDPMAMGILVLITGLPLFLLFLFLQRRESRKNVT